MDGFNWGYPIWTAIGAAAASFFWFMEWSEIRDQRDGWRKRCERTEDDLGKARVELKRETQLLKGAKLELYALRERIEDAIDACGGSVEKQ